MKNNKIISVIIPAYNAEADIGNLIASLRRQTFSNFETIIVDDCSNDKTANMAREYCRVITLKKNQGPSIARNIGTNHAQGEILAFTDTDCIPAFDWLERIDEVFLNPTISAVMGKLYIPQSNFIGDSISALGFPAGGSIGFEKIWPVDSDGFTNHLSSSNFAIRKNVIRKIGGFDGDFSIYCEDSEFAFRLIKAGIKIKFCPDIVVSHKPMTSFFVFIKNHIKRGQGNYIFRKKLSYVGDFIKMRLWSTKNIFRTYYKDVKFPLIFILLGMSFLCQQIGYIRRFLKETSKT